MVKKNQIALVLLTLVLMLSIFFIKRSEINKEINDDNEQMIDEVTAPLKVEALTQMRLVLNEERDLRILELDQILASSDATVYQKNIALEEKRYISAIREKEALLEFEIIESGYFDCFVHASDVGVEITVISETKSAEEASDIIKKAMLDFTDSEQILVTFKTKEEVGKI